MRIPHHTQRRRVGYAGAALILAAILAACGGQTTTTTQRATLPIKQGDVEQRVSGSGTIAPFRESFLNFVTNGTVAKVTAEEGQTVKQGTPLASLDTSDLDLQITQAQANLKSAQANLANLKVGAKDTDLRSAQAQLTAAQLQLSQTAKSSAKPGEIASAQAQLRSAQIALAALRNPTQNDRDTAQANIQDAQNSLDSTRNSASASKTQADLSLQQATNSLTQSQASYATAKKEWEYVQETGKNPSASGGTTSGSAPKLNDTQRQQYYDSFVQAEASLRNAESQVQAAQLSFDNARQKEVTDVAAAEQAVADAQRQLNALLNPSPKDLAAAQAQVTSAQSQLSQLTSGGTKTDIAIAQQTVAQRQAALDALKLPPTDADVAQSDASIAQAEASLAQAQRNRANAELTAPFDGTIAAVNITLGASTGGTNATSNQAANTAAIYLVDTTAYHVNVNISEVDLGSLKVGQSAQVTVQALPGQVLSGTVSYIAQTPTVDQNVTTYSTRIDLAPTKQPLRVGLSANVAIIVAQRTGVVVVPNIAIEQGENGAQVLLQNGESSTPTGIKTGVVGDTNTEVTSGLKVGDIVIIPGATGGANNQNRGGFGGGLFGGGARPGGGGGAGGGGGRP